MSSGDSNFALLYQALTAPFSSIESSSSQDHIDSVQFHSSPLTFESPCISMRPTPPCVSSITCTTAYRIISYKFHSKIHKHKILSPLTRPNKQPITSARKQKISNFKSSPVLRCIHSVLQLTALRLQCPKYRLCTDYCNAVLQQSQINFNFAAMRCIELR